MHVDDLILISVDDHLIEPPDLFAGHLPAKFQDRAPKLVRNDEGNDVWTFGDVVMETAALNAVAGRPKEEYGLEPQSLDEVRPGCYDPHERVKDMNAGVRDGEELLRFRANWYCSKGPPRTSTGCRPTRDRAEWA